jgi:hypothetical protein
MKPAVGTGSKTANLNEILALLEGLQTKKLARP